MFYPCLHSGCGFKTFQGAEVLDKLTGFYNLAGTFVDWKVSSSL